MKTSVQIIVSSISFAEDLAELILDSDLDIEVVGIQSNGALGIEQFQITMPKIVILDASIAIIGTEKYIQLMQDFSNDFLVILLTGNGQNGPFRISGVFSTISRNNFDASVFIDVLRSAVLSINYEDETIIDKISQNYYNNLTSLIGDGNLSQKKFKVLADELHWKLTPVISFLLPRPEKRIESIPVPTLKKLEENLKNVNGGYVFLMQDGILCFILNEPSNSRRGYTREQQKRLYEAILQTLRSDFLMNFSFFVSNYTQLENADNELKNIRDLYDFGYYLSQHQVVRRADLPVVNQTLWSGFNELVSDLCFSFFKGNFCEFSVLIEDHYQKTLKTRLSYEDLAATRMLLELLSQTFQSMCNHSPATDVFSLDHNTIEEECTTIVEHFSELFGFIKPLELKLSDSIIKVISIMISNVSEDINVGWIADKIPVSPSYLSHRFRSETGLTLIAYLQFIRITKAKRLMTSPDLKLYEISQKSGFASYQYFNSVFKKLTGITPTDFRNDMD